MWFPYSYLAINNFPGALNFKVYRQIQTSIYFINTSSIHHQSIINPSSIRSEKLGTKYCIDSTSKKKEVGFHNIHHILLGHLLKRGHKIATTKTQPSFSIFLNFRPLYFAFRLKARQKKSKLYVIFSGKTFDLLQCTHFSTLSSGQLVSSSYTIAKIKKKEFEISGSPKTIIKFINDAIDNNVYRSIFFNIATMFVFVLLLVIYRITKKKYIQCKTGVVVGCRKYTASDVIRAHPSEQIRFRFERHDGTLSLQLIIMIYGSQHIVHIS